MTAFATDAEVAVFLPVGVVVVCVEVILERATPQTQAHKDLIVRAALEQEVVVGTHLGIWAGLGVVGEVHVVGRGLAPSQSQLEGGLDAVPQVECGVHVDTAVVLPHRHEHGVDEVHSQPQRREPRIAGIVAADGVLAHFLLGG